MVKTSVIVVRHGETKWNVTRQLQGRKNSNLTENGIKQAVLTAEALKNKSFDFLYTSDLRRALETTEIINKYHQLEIHIDESLAERNFGVIEGLKQDEMIEKYPEVFTRYMKREEEYQIPDGESLISFYNRVKKGLNAIANSHTGKRILIVTHGGVLDCMMRMVFNYPLSAPRSFSIYNASVNRFSVTDGTWFLEKWGEISHQESMALSLDI